MDAARFCSRQHSTAAAAALPPPPLQLRRGNSSCSLLRPMLSSPPQPSLIFLPRPEPFFPTGWQEFQLQRFSCRITGLLSFSSPALLRPQFPQECFQKRCSSSFFICSQQHPARLSREGSGYCTTTRRLPTNSQLQAIARSPLTTHGFLISASFKRLSDGVQPLHATNEQTEKYEGKKIFTGTDVALGVIDVYGWSVEFEGKGKVGKVVEILHIGRSGPNINEDSTYEYVLKVLQVSKEESVEKRKVIDRLEHPRITDKNKRSSGTEILIPIVDEFIQQVDAKRRCLLIKPPEGLLDLARRPEALRKLRPAIHEFCRQHVGFLQERFTSNRKIKFDGSKNLQDIVHTYMPTRDQFQAAGRLDLIRQIKAAGGFLFVAQALGLKATRRPNGFWDDLGKLDTEIEQFLWENWIKKIHKETGMVYFENQVTKDVALEKPKLISGSQPSSLGGEGLKVMPQQKAIWKAGRWDLHHAIVWNGGYREVAHALGRHTLRKSGKLSQQQKDAISLLASNCAFSKGNRSLKFLNKSAE